MSEIKRIRQIARVPGRRVGLLAASAARVVIAPQALAGHRGRDDEIMQQQAVNVRRDSIRAARFGAGGRARLAAVLAATAVCGAVAVGAAPDAAAITAFEPDDKPCEPGAVPGFPPGIDVRICPDWSPNGRIPVYKEPFSSKRVGFINAASDDGYVCGVEGGLHELRGFKNNWWAYTKPDGGSGEFGYVPQTYFRGGGDFTKDAGLPDCPGSFPQPGGRQQP